MSLQGYLFFGSANQLYQYVKSLLARCPQCKYLLLDFRLVAGVDSSSVFSFEQIKQATEILGVRLTLAHLSRQTEAAFRSAGIVSKNVSVSGDLDTAVEECEAAIIAAHGSLEKEVGTLRTWLHEAFGGPGYEVALKQYCQRVEVGTGEVVARQGAPLDSMHFIVEGRVGISVSAGGERSVRVRSLGQYTTHWRDGHDHRSAT